MHTRLRTGLRTGALMLAAALAGCVSTGTSPSVRFYSLDSYHPDRSDYSYVVAVGPFELPDYLDKPQIVSRGDNNRLVVREFDRWGEPLDTAISRRMAGNLGQALPDVFAYEFTTLASSSPDLRILGQIWAFEARPDNTVALSASWTIRRDGRPTGIAGHSNVSRPLNTPGDTDELVRVMGELVDALSAEMANGLRTALPLVDAARAAESQAGSDPD